MKMDDRRGINQAMQRTNFRNATTAREACQLGVVFRSDLDQTSKPASVLSRSRHSLFPFYGAGDASDRQNV